MTAGCRHRGDGVCGRVPTGCLVPALVGGDRTAENAGGAGAVLTLLLVATAAVVWPPRRPARLAAPGGPGGVPRLARISAQGVGAIPVSAVTPLICGGCH